MLYYHLLIETNEPSEKYYVLNKTNLSEIKEEIIIPYLKGEQFMFDGYFLDNSKVKRIVIGESKYSSKEYVNREQANVPSNVYMVVRPTGIVTSARYTKNIVGRILEECKSLLQEATPKSKTLPPNHPKALMDKSKVFIVHGHDDAAKEAAARFVEKIGLEAIILHEQASSGQTIIEKIEANSNVGFGIVLYTPCDLGESQKQKDQPKPRARQNVVFEHGYLIGKIGRKNVCALVKGDIETPNDISGVVYIKMEGEKEWKYKVADEMKACGYDIDLNKI